MIDEKRVMKRLAMIKGSVELFQGKRDEALANASTSVLSGNQTDAIKYATLAEYFGELALELTELSKSDNMIG